MKIARILAAVLTLSLLGCVNLSHSTGTTQLNRELVEKSLVHGKTTKAQVLALLGEPQTTTMSGGNAYMPAETWLYRKTFYHDANQGGAVRGAVYTAVTGNYYDRVESSVLIVMFDKRGVLTNYSFSTAR